MGKTVNGTETRFLHAGDMEIAEYSSSGALLRRYIPGGATDARVAYVEGSGTALTAIKYYHADRLGSVAALSDSAGKVSERYAYDPYGNETSGASVSGQLFRYTGRKLDPESGLYYYRARYYDPEMGRFLQTDPVGYADQFNLYTYVANDPLNNIDPTGRESYLVRRPIDVTGNRGFHLYIVTHVNVDGRDPAVYSWGKAPGQSGISRLTGSNATSMDDNAHATDFFSGRENVGGSAQQIFAPDDVVADFAERVNVDGKSYAPTGQNLNPFDDAMNSAAPPTAVAVAANNSAGNPVTGRDVLPPSTGLGTAAPGWGDYSDVQFDSETGRVSGEITRTGSRISKRETMARVREE